MVELPQPVRDSVRLVHNPLLPQTGGGKRETGQAVQQLFDTSRTILFEVSRTVNRLAFNT